MTDAHTQGEAPPAGEQLHLPGPSAVPLLNAVGLSVAILGLTMGPELVIVGLVLFLLTTVLWIRDAARDVGELPLDHSQH